MFFKQINSLVFLGAIDKLNLLAALVFMFGTIMFAMSSYILFSYFSSKKFSILYPTYKPNCIRANLIFFMTGPGHKLLLGSIQAFY